MRRLLVVAALMLVLVSPAMASESPSVTAHNRWWASTSFEGVYQLCQQGEKGFENYDDVAASNLCIGILGGVFSTLGYVDSIDFGVEVEGKRVKLVTQDGVTVGQLIDSVLRHANEKRADGKPFRLLNAIEAMIRCWLEDGYVSWQEATPTGERVQG